MAIHLQHHRAFCENLGHLHDIGVSWDGEGSKPLQKRSLQAAMEFFGRRPDLAIGAKTGLVRGGGVQVGLFREGRDITILICPKGSVRISRHRPRMRPDFTLYQEVVNTEVFRTLEDALPCAEDTPLLDYLSDGDVRLPSPFDGFMILRLAKSDTLGCCRLYMGREGPVPDLYAFHDAIHIPEDLPVDQTLTGQARLSDLLAAYRVERSQARVPAPNC
jgi:hypothetical protein